MAPVYVEGGHAPAFGEAEQILEDEYWDQAGWSLSQKRVGAEGNGCHLLDRILEE